MFLFSTGGRTVRTSRSVLQFCLTRCHAAPWWMIAGSSADSMSEHVIGTGGGRNVSDWRLWGCIWMLLDSGFRTLSKDSPAPQGEQPAPEPVDLVEISSTHTGACPEKSWWNPGAWMTHLSLQLNKWVNKWDETRSFTQQLVVSTMLFWSFSRGGSKYQVMLCAHLAGSWTGGWTGGSMTGPKKNRRRHDEHTSTCGHYNLTTAIKK